MLGLHLVLMDNLQLVLSKTNKIGDIEYGL